MKRTDVLIILLIMINTAIFAQKSNDSKKVYLMAFHKYGLI